MYYILFKHFSLYIYKLVFIVCYIMVLHTDYVLNQV